jgi:hypothetical protein
MLRNWRYQIAAVGLLLLALQPARAQVGVLTIRSVDDALSDVKYLLAVAGQEDRARQLEGLIGALTAGKNLQGIDTKKPLGIYVGDVKDGDMPPAVIFIPITKQDEFIDLLKQAGLDPSKPEKGIYSIDTPLGQTIYLRFANQHAYVSDGPDKLEGDLPSPSSFLPASSKDSLIAASMLLDKIPAELKKQALEQLDQQFAADKEKKEGESDQEYQFRMAAQRAVRAAIASVMEEGKQLTLAFNVDQKASNLALYAGVTAKEGSKLAARIKEFGSVGDELAPIHIEVSLGKLAMMFLPEDEEKAAEIRKIFSDKAKGKDKIKLILQGGQNLQLRLEVNAGVIAVLAKLAPQGGDN